MDGTGFEPASSIDGLNQSGALYGKSAVKFFEEFLMCFIGDPNLKAWDKKSLGNLRTEYKAKNAIIISITETDPKPFYT
ncbi:hypothetical protein JJE00_05845 [Candidatus Bathyarchaeota archaeon]|nr:hypothetical protein [Candidatus Bathyarchaeota archaeon]